MPPRWQSDVSPLASFGVWVAAFGAQAAAVFASSSLDFLPLVFIGGVLVLWLWSHSGGLFGGLALSGQLVLLVIWTLRAGGEPRLVWEAAVIWWGGVGLYLYAGGRRSRWLQERARWRRDRLAAEANELEQELRRKEHRLDTSVRWLDRLGSLVNLAEELLPALTPAALARGLRNGVPALLPPAERFFFYRATGDELQPLVALLPTDEATAVRPDGLDRFVISEARPLLIEDAASAPEGMATDRPIGSLVAAPLTARVQERAGSGIRQVIGLLRVEAVARHAYGRSDLELLNVVADLAARVLLNTDLYEKSAQLAVYDALTGLQLRHVFYDNAARALARARRENAPVSLAIFDIDNFKVFNDTWGHVAGDLVLRRIADIIASEAAAGELACRYGGEELALLTHQDISRASRRVERIIKRAEAERYMLPDEAGALREARATLSAGVAAFPLHADELVSLLQQADRALYRAKRLGKNTFVVARSR